MTKFDLDINSFETLKKSLLEKKNIQQKSSGDWRFTPKLIKGETKTTYKVRVLPNIKNGKIDNGPNPPWIQANVHIFNTAEGKMVYEICPTTFQNKCPICEFSKFLFGKGDKNSTDLARQYWIKRRYFVNVLVKEDPRKGEENQAGKVLVWEFGSKIYDKFIEAILTHNLFFWHQTEGYDFNLIVKQVSNYQNYDSSDFSRKPSAICNPDEEEKIIKNIKDLNEVILNNRVKTYDELKSLLGNFSSTTNENNKHNLENKNTKKESQENVVVREKVHSAIHKSENVENDDIDIDKIKFDDDQPPF
ncbi:MAG: hypothetical protein NZZ41_01210 [Candidatus Dojkabacteria bacterium]|nr:hypothetical protein [Candidatus Dojkabacteria bacterium]